MVGLIALDRGCVDDVCVLSDAHGLRKHQPGVTGPAHSAGPACPQAWRVKDDTFLLADKSDAPQCITLM